MKEKVIVSSCLLGVNCNYKGENAYSESIIKYLEDKEIIAVCPEVLGGLPIPRVSCEIRLGKVVSKDGVDVSNQFVEGSKKVLDLIKKHKVKKAILKSKSPSCGYGLIYDGTFTSTLIKENGVTAQLLLDHGVEILNSDMDEFIENQK